MPLSIPDRLYYRDIESVSSKLTSFAAAGPQKLHIVSDFDLTLTAGKHPGDNLGTWDVMDALMPEEGVARHTAIYQSFRPIEVAGKLTQAIAAEKWAETLDLITSYHMSIDDIEEAFLSVAMLRPGAKDMFDTCKRIGIPTVILSSGIRNVIEIMAKHYGIHTDFILSNDLAIDTSSHVSGWQKDSLVHVLNKREMGHGELTELRATHPNILLLGDVPADADMVEGHDDVIRIRVLDPRKGETYNQASALQASFNAGYDLVTEHSLEPVVNILEQLTM
jgi:cytosolic 5'-nucleotidase 3